MRSPDIPLHCEFHRSNVLTIGEVIFDQQHLLELSVEVGFYKRAPRKIDICSLLGSICSGSTKGSPSCIDLAASIEASYPFQGPSRQAVHLRLGEPMNSFLGRLVAEVIADNNEAQTPVRLVAAPRLITPDADHPQGKTVADRLLYQQYPRTAAAIPLANASSPHQPSQTHPVSFRFTRQFSAGHPGCVSCPIRDQGLP